MNRIETAIQLRDRMMEQFLTEGDCHSDDIYYFEMILDSFTDTELLAFDAATTMCLN